MQELSWGISHEMILPLKLVLLLGCPLVIYLLSLKNEVLTKPGADAKLSGSIMQPQQPISQQDISVSDADLMLDDDFDINSLINAEEDL